MCWQTRISGQLFRKVELLTPGARMPMSSASLPGGTILFAIRAERRFTSVMKSAATSGPPRRCPAAGRRIRSELRVYVAMDAPIKFSVLKVRNESGRSRRLSATGYAEWVLGDLRPKTTMHVVTEVDTNSGALFARNSYNTEFAGRVAFFDVDDVPRTYSGDRTEFIGRNGTPRNPAAMHRLRLSGRVVSA